ncbi:MAG: DUF484 domain-containing protein [Hydrogenophilales bacterium CG17_big_fil_post_rev_8_21_14_2_50_63_12]|nr:MAG: DUF484 domain-containing protein [Hydrogenophilales bacterium CG17_big_fil_post_rev_8_21_14_2_50_63_12]PIX96272.1 MAG: DUF484 domain-containing protein [Hydrogenophilales bacterium CG_4_10_14_3_um_filter_63_21]PJB03716.1 MAG: DUF484 domain-containing protein [Hydrogenophilales bacterium CG_4_9_14_3_um_filter_63_34]
MNITPEQINEFLKLNPDFFLGHPELLTEITVPHPYSGQAISLGERQVLALRDKSRGLEIKLREFIQFAEENDAIGDKLHKLSLDLMRAKTLDAALQSFYLRLSESFSVPHTALRIWTANAPDMPEFAKVSVDIQVLVEGLSQPQCGPDVPEEVRAWFGEVGAHQKSFALAPLKEGNLTGLMVLASEDSKRFYPEMGTLYLTWLAELGGAACARFL